MQTFSFGGQIGENPENVDECTKKHPLPCNIVDSDVLSKGSDSPMIKPDHWGEMGTPRKMTFFVPYTDFATLTDGQQFLLVKVTTIDNEQTVKQLSFVNSGYFIKIANNGNELPESALLGNQPNDWACLKDTKTGLIWEIKTDDGGLRDKDWMYTWYDPKYLPDTYDDNRGYYDSGHDANGIWAGWENPESPPYNTQSINETVVLHTNMALCNANPVYCNTDAYTKAVNAKTLCGASDWRVPTQNEQLGITDSWPYTTPYMGFWGDYYNNRDAYAYYWSSSSYVDDALGAFFVIVTSNSIYGHGIAYKHTAFGVRLVRDGQ